MNTPKTESYRIRLIKAMDYIDAHLDQEISVDSLSRIAACSKYHFHRQFSAFFGIGVYRYIQLRRLKQASYQLAFRPGSRIIDIALSNGYDGPESFARAFRKRFGQSPSDFRKRPQWAAWVMNCRLLSAERKQSMGSVYTPEQIKIVDFPATNVATLEHRGDPNRLGDSIRSFIEWRKRHRLPPSISATFNLLYDDPSAVAPEEFRFDLCAATTQNIADNDQGVIGKIIPAGRCAMLRHQGSDDGLGPAIAYLYRDWLPRSGEVLREFPLYLQRIRFFPDVPEHEALTDIFLPLE